MVFFEVEPSDVGAKSRPNSWKNVTRPSVYYKASGAYN